MLVLAAAIPFAVYLATMPPDIVFEDAGIFASACYTGGLAHPPGYPLHTLLCVPFAHLDALLPISPAMGAAILSALANALAAAILLWIFRQIFRDATLALGLALAYAFGLHSWSQAIIPEVYTLNALLFFSTFALVMRFRETGRVGFACAAALAAGLGLSNHWPLFLCAAPACALLLLDAPHRLRPLMRPRAAAACLALLALGLLPYARMFHIPEDAYVFLPLAGAEDFISYLSRDIYLDRIERLEVAERFAHALSGIPIVFEEHFLPLSLLALPGAAACWRKRGPWLFAAMLWLPLSSLVLLKVAAGYFWLDEIERRTFAVYHQIAFGAMAYFIGEGLLWAGGLLRAPPKAVSAAALGIPLAALAANWEANQRHNDTFALQYAELYWKTIPQNAIVEFGGDIAFPLEYLRHTRDVRPDVEESDLASLLGYEQFNRAVLSDEEVRHLARIERPLILQRRLSGNFSIINLGVVDRVVMEPEMSDVSMDRENAAFMAAVAARYADETDTWNRGFMAQLLESTARLLARVRYERPDEFTPGLRELYLKISATLPGQLGIYLARVIDGVSPMPAGDIIRQAEALRLAFPEMSRSQRALLLGIQGTAFAALGDLDRAKERFARSIRASPSAKENSSVYDLLQLLALEGEWEAYRDMRLRYRTIPAAKALEETDALCAEALGASCSTAQGEAR